MKGTIIIIICAVISFSFAITANMTHKKYGGISNFLVPVFTAMVGIILFMIISMITKNKTMRRIAVIIFCCYLVYVGITLHDGKYPWLPIPF